MIQVLLLSFREYFEAFLLISGFSILCSYYGLKRTREIVLGATIAFTSSLALTIYVYSTSSQFFTEAKTDTIEGWLLLTSSLLIALFAFPIHTFIWGKIEKRIPQAENRIKDQEKFFDWILFLFVFIITFKEGMEALLFTVGASLTNDFIYNVAGLLIGMFTATIAAFIIRNSIYYLKMDKIFWILALMLLLGSVSIFRQGLELVTGLSYITTDILAAVYGVIIYGFFIRNKNISTE